MTFPDYLNLHPAHVWLVLSLAVLVVLSWVNRKPK